MELERLSQNIQDLQSRSQFVDEPTFLGIDQNRWGYFERYGFVTEAGYAYSGVVGIPKDQETELAFLGTTAWLTSTLGHYEHTALRALKNGIPWIFVGAEGSYRPPIMDYPIPKYGLSLTGSAGATLQFAKYASETHRNVIDSEEKALLGESRGGMVGMGVVALDEFFGQHIAYSDLTAPCFPRRISLGDILNLSGHIVSEPKSVLRMATDLGIRQIVHYPPTIDPHPYSIAHQVAMAPALLSGEAGDLARLIPEEEIRHVTCFDDDFASMPEEWKEIMGSLPNVRITLLGGSHLSIAESQTLGFLIARHKAYRELDGLNQDISGEALFRLAHHYV